MMLAIIFWMTLILSCAYVVRVGERDEKVCIVAFAMASLASTYVISPLPSRLRTMEWPMFGVDVVLLLIFLVFVIRSKRYWPLWTTGMQVVSLVGYTAVISRVRPSTGGMTLGILAYLILATIVIAASRSSRKRYSAATSFATPPAAFSPPSKRSDDISPTADVQT